MDDTRLPWMKFYPGDWLRDAALRTCSIAARGLWVELLCVMHANADRRGYLTLPTGLPMNSGHIARMVGISTQQADEYLAELEEAGVFSRDESGVIFSRRMVRDDNTLRVNKANGAKGGNPKLKGSDKGGDNRGDNPQDKGGDKARCQKSDVRDQMSEGFTELLDSDNPKHNQSGSIAPQRAKPRSDAKGADKPKNLTVEEARQHNLPLTWDLEMRKAFAKFIDQRYASGRKCTAHAIDLLVKDVEKMPVDLRLDAINQSTANGYQGIFMPNARRHTKANIAPANTAAAQPFLTLREVIDKGRAENIAAARQNGTHKT